MSSAGPVAAAAGLVATEAALLPVAELHQQLLGLNKEEQVLVIAALPSVKRRELSSYIHAVEEGLANMRRTSAVQAAAPCFDFAAPHRGKVPEPDPRIAVLEEKRRRLRAQAAGSWDPGVGLIGSSGGPDGALGASSGGSPDNASGSEGCSVWESDDGGEASSAEELSSHSSSARQTSDTDSGYEAARTRLLLKRRELQELKLQRSHLVASAEELSGTASKLSATACRSRLRLEGVLREGSTFASEARHGLGMPRSVPERLDDDTSEEELEVREAGHTSHTDDPMQRFTGMSFEALMQRLRTASAEERRDWIQAMPQDQFNALINLMSRQPEPKDLHSDASSTVEEELLNTESSSDRDGLTTQHQPDVDSNGGIASSAMCIVDTATGPGTARNTQPLGRLQPDGYGAFAHPTSMAYMPFTMAPASEAVLGHAHRADLLTASGVDGVAIRAWLSGEISGCLCHAKVLEAVAMGRFHMDQEKREMSRTVELYSELAAPLGGCLGALVGGLATLAASNQELAGSILEGVPDAAVHSAAMVFRADSVMKDEASSLDAEAVNFEFRRQCLRSHPQREMGRLLTYIQVHCSLEILRQSFRCTHYPFRRNGLEEHSNSDDLAGVQAEFSRSDAEAARAAEGLSSAELNAWNERTSRYILNLAWQKDSLNALLEQLRASEAYAVLGIAATASDVEVARAYKAAAIRLHPDKGGDAEQFKVLANAYKKILAARQDIGKTKDGKGDSPSAECAPAKGGQRGADAQKVPNAKASAPVAESNSRMAKAESNLPMAKATVEGEFEFEATKDTRSAAEEDASDAEVPVTVPGPGPACAPHKLGHGHEEAGHPEPWTPRSGDHQEAEDQSEAHAAALVDAIPVEAISQQAEHALDAAEMCVNVAKLAQDAAAKGSRSWPQLLECGTHLLNSAHLVVEATHSIGRCATGTPSDVLPLLERIRLAKEINHTVASATRDLMRCTEMISERGLKATTITDALMLRSKDMLEMMRNVAGASTMSDYACRTFAETLRCVANCARDSADAAAAAAVVVADAQRRAQRLGEMLAGNPMAEDQGKEPKKERESSEDPEADAEQADAGGDNEGKCKDTPRQRHEENRRLLLKLNGDVLGLQKEMKLLVTANPQLLPEVRVAQKERVFALAAELMQQARQAVVWTGQRCTTGRRAVAAAVWAQAIEAALDLVQAAADWERVAIPGFEARVLRTAALIDSCLLARLIRRELVDHCMALAPDGAKSNRGVSARFSAAISKLCCCP